MSLEKARKANWQARLILLPALYRLSLCSFASLVDEGIDLIDRFSTVLPRPPTLRAKRTLREVPEMPRFAPAAAPRPLQLNDLPLAKVPASAYNLSPPSMTSRQALP